MTATQALQNTIRGKTPMLRHDLALKNPQGFELPIVGIMRCLADYADSHWERYGSPVGDDGVLGEEWRNIAEALIGLLNGETGRLDCGTVDHAIREMGKAAGAELT